MVLKNYEDIVTNFKSPTLVLAGPGSGKTFLLADRVTRLLKNKEDKETITVLTYTTDANQNMVEKLTDPNGDFKVSYKELPQIKTIHSLGLTIVQEDPHAVNLLKTDLQVQEDENIKRLIFRDAALILGFDEDISNKARECKQNGNCKKNAEKKTCRTCIKYWEIMSKCNRVDFDDQILFACQILESDPEILKKYQSKAKHLLVDEYQDINTAQFRFIELLSRDSRNGLFVVGDDAQSIYGFRGGDPKFILRFQQDFPGAEIGTLNVSRRCHKNIMDDAFVVLEKYYTNWTGKPTLKYLATGSDKPFIYNCPSEVTEAKMVAIIAKSAVQDKKDVLILAPKKDFFPLIIKELLHLGLYADCQVSFLPKRFEIADRFLNWVEGPKNSFITRLVVEDLINIGFAKIPGANKKQLRNQKSLRKRIAEETEIAKLWESVDKNTNLFEVIQKIQTPKTILAKIFNGLNLLLETYNDCGKNPGEFAKQLSFISGIWVNPLKLAEDIETVVGLLDPSKPVIRGTVQLRTMRKAKGLQAKVVIIVGLENDIVPDPNSDITEQARLFYVSMTRAQEKLYLFHSYKRPRNISYGPDFTQKQKSQFLDVIGRKSEWKQLST
ncbi:MAG: ATP-dependent helicase [Sedimentisphaerales bacterium]